MDMLWDLLTPQRLTGVVDIGANPIDSDPPYRQMLRDGLCRVTGFEPQPEALASLLEHKGPDEQYLPYVVGDGDPHVLKVCQESGMTSLLEPDPAALALFGSMRASGEVVERVPVQTRRLDDIEEIEILDLLKIDVQGGELAVFRGGREKLARAVVIQTEVSFVTLYRDQPGFGEIDVELRSQGFVPHCFALGAHGRPVKRWPIAPVLVNQTPQWAMNQLLEADLVYVRDIGHLELLNDEQVKHLALIAHHCYGSYDLALRCLLHLEVRGALSEGAHRRYLEAFATVTCHDQSWATMQVKLGIEAGATGSIAGQVAGGPDNCRAAVQG
jgi:FkbM family methyltransferase